MKSLKIGNIQLKNRIFLAPMVDVTDLPFRLLCRKFGAAIAYTEMINVPAIIHTNEKTEGMMKTCDEDKPLGVQITGKELKDYRKVVPYLKKFDLVDVNAGCPSIRIAYNSNSGSYLLKNPAKIGKIIRVLKDRGLTVTGKVRLGFEKNNVLSVAREVEMAGADALTIHARLSNESYKVPAQWDWIKKVKEKIGIPVIGNGDIDSGEKTARMLDIADGAMVGRAAIGNPLIFEQILNYLKTGKEKEASYKQRVKIFNDYLKIAKKYDIVNIARIKFLGSHFLRGFTGASKKREELMKLNDFDSVREFVTIF